MAAHGHAGLPMQVGSPIGGADKAQLPPNAPHPAFLGAGGPQSAQMPPAAGGSAAGDRQIAEHASQMLLAAAHQASDPALKASFSQALAALHKYIAQDEKESQQALQGKMSPKIMARAHGRA